MKKIQINKELFTEYREVNFIPLLEYPTYVIENIIDGSRVFGYSLDYVNEIFNNSIKDKKFFEIKEIEWI